MGEMIDRESLFKAINGAAKREPAMQACKKICPMMSFANVGFTDTALEVLAHRSTQTVHDALRVMPSYALSHTPNALCRTPQAITQCRTQRSDDKSTIESS